MNILAVDVGHITGWAISMKEKRKKRIFKSGEADFSACRGEDTESKSWGKLYNDFEHWLTSMCLSHGIDLLVFEISPNPWKSWAARLSIVGLTAIVYKVGDKLKLNMTPVPVTVTKQFATGKGNCGKNEMLVALREKHGIDTDSTHECDAVWMVKYVEEMVI